MAILKGTLSGTIIKVVPHEVATYTNSQFATHYYNYNICPTCDYLDFIQNGVIKAQYSLSELRTQKSISFTGGTLYVQIISNAGPSASGSGMSYNLSSSQALSIRSSTNTSFSNPITIRFMKYEYEN